MSLDVQNIVRVTAKIDHNFMKLWLEFLKPIHKLTSREIDVTAMFFMKRLELSREVENPAILDTLLLSDDIRSQIREECNITPAHLNMLMYNLRKKGMIVDNRFNLKYFPNITLEDSKFNFLLHFEFK